MAAQKPRISCEFFPPKTGAGIDRLLTEVMPALNALGPEFFSVTYGAGGSTRDTTVGLVSSIREAGIDVAPHLSFGGDDDSTIAALLETYQGADCEGHEGYEHRCDPAVQEHACDFETSRRLWRSERWTGK